MAFLKTSRSYFLALTVATALAACSGDDGVGDSDATSSSSTSDSSASSTSDSSATATTTATATATASGTGTDSGTDSGTSTGEPTTDATTTDPTTGESTSTGEPTTDATTDATDGTDGTDTEDPTGGIDDSGCAAACDTLTMCIPDFPLDECLADCNGEFDEGEGAACKAATSKANMCFATLECEQIFNEDYGECVPVIDAADEACGGGMGVCEANLMKMGKGCRVSFDCGDSQSGMQCNQQGCICVENGEQVGQCQNNDFCALDLDAAIDAANECCGWDF